MNRWFLYDGDCAFCSACGRFITRHIRTDVVVQPWQFVDLGALGLTAAECEQAVQWVALAPDGRREAASGPAAIGALLRRGSLPWHWVGVLLGTRPALLAAGPVYVFVARHRDRMPGGSPACAVPRARP
jgi:predicted DCC family thiol-disulfide oxidoreductase YuxK